MADKIRPDSINTIYQAFDCCCSQMCCGGCSCTDEFIKAIKGLGVSDDEIIKEGFGWLIGQEKAPQLRG